ncbi:MAG: diaminopimelate epimerase [Deltaproteobacteria bacterium]
MKREIQFGKFHGLGNDFIVARGEGLPGNLSALARAITARNTGVGADGFLVVLAPRDPSNDARVRFFNSDGSEPEMSGNGIRCVGAFLLSGSRPKPQLAIETPAGLKTLRLMGGRDGSYVFRVSMGAPILEAKHIPFRPGRHKSPIVGFPLRTRAGNVRATVTSMGNPHCTVFVRNFESCDWQALGRAIERDRHFPNRTNVEFVRVISRRSIEVRFWERGVGFTQSSGTGSCGATVASILNGFTGRKVSARTLAGNLEIEWPEGGEVLLTGPAERIAEGSYFCAPSR